MRTILVQRSKQVIAGGLTVSLLAVGTVAAASSANISRSYETKEKITNASLVSLDKADGSTVVSANTANDARLVGVATEDSDSLLAVNSTAGDIQIATSGTVTALVSSVNGEIKSGDQVAVSPFNGIGVKAAPGNRVIGLAQTSFSGKGSDVTRKTVTAKSGEASEVSVGYIRLTIGIGMATTAGTQDNLNSLQRLGRSLTGRTISTARIIISLVVAVVALVALITLIYASVFSGIISVGRNPLAKYSVFRTMTIVLVMAIGLAAIASLTIFLILR